MDQIRGANKRLIYTLAALGFGMMFLSSAIKGVYQVYFADLATHFGRGRADFAWSGAIFVLATGFMSPVVGALSDRVGPLRTVATGAFIGGIALLAAASWHGTLFSFVLAYGIGGAFALAAMTYVPMGILVDRLFEQKNKGLAYAVVTNGTSVGFIVLSPLWIWLQPQLNWTSAFFAVGIVLAGPAAALVWFMARAADAAQLGQRSKSSGDKPRVWRQVRGDSGLYVLAFGFFCCGATMAFIDVHLVPYWRDIGASRSEMGFSLSLLGVLELISGIATGWLAIRMDKHLLLGAFYAVRSIAMWTLFSTSSGVPTLVFAALFGATYLGTVVLTSMYCFERYGVAIKGQVFGLLFMVHQLGAFASVQLGAMAFDHYGSYQPAIMVLGALTMVATVVSWFGLRAPAARAVQRSALAAYASQAGAWPGTQRRIDPHDDREQLRWLVPPRHMLAFE